ncbi:RNA polymerase sigma factor [Eubacterium sp.]|uniref:RNA polymerase sigma factor n=1 Tax=Eubacterium sp. TaxID=142586 RepID=UPI0025FD0B9E|nr:RNA polymerase sigma factor [Eubacterium sp.]MCR5630226.1 RNA polymerase sigma factor [Eubacterium sp.]
MSGFIRTEEDVENTIRKYSSLLFRTSFFMLNNKADADDVVQETFCRYMTTDISFNEEEHKKAWLIKVAQNKCRDLLRFHKVRVHIPYEEVEEHLLYSEDVKEKDIEELLELAKLNYKYKSVLLLYYYEGYSVEEIADILDISANAVKKRLQRAREKVKVAYEKNYKGSVRSYEI